MSEIKNGGLDQYGAEPFEKQQFGTSAVKGVKTLYSGLSQSDFKDHCGDAMSGYDCRNKCVFSFWRNVVSDGADWTSTGRLFQSRGPAAAKQRSPTVTSLDGRTSRRLEVDERSRPRRLDGRSATY